MKRILQLPERVRCWGLATLGREYLVTTQQLDIYGTASSAPLPVVEDYETPHLSSSTARHGLFRPSPCRRRLQNTASIVFDNGYPS